VYIYLFVKKNKNKKREKRERERREREKGGVIEESVCCITVSTEVLAIFISFASIFLSL
jgi:hypothetical protein